MNEQIALPMQTRRGVSVAAVDGEARTINVTWSTGAPVRRMNLMSGRIYDEVLSLKAGHVDLTRLNAGAPLLNAHGKHTLADVIGVVERAWVGEDGGRVEGRAVVRLSDRAEVEPIWRDIQAGIIRNISVGYAVRAFEVSDGAEVPTWTAIDWEPMELSAVPIGADAGAGIREPEAVMPCVLYHRAECAHNMEVQVMDHIDPVADTRAADHVPAGDVERQEPAEAPEIDAGAMIAAERVRIAEIYEAARALKVDFAEANALVRSGAGIDEARKAFINKVAERGDRVETRPHIRILVDERETRAQAIENALLNRYDAGQFPLTEAGREWRGMSILELGRGALEGQGERVRGLGRDELATRALHTTSDFPLILANVAGKTLRKAYEAAPRTFTLVARRAVVPDFRLVSRGQFGEAPALLKVNEAGEFKRGTIGEGAESYRVETWGRVVGITRQVLVNDDLDAFTRLPAMFGVSAANLESDTVWNVIKDNAAMADTVALFHGNHGNLAGTGTALSATTIAAARAAMAKQKGLDGATFLNIRPAFIVVPAALEFTAEQIIAANLTPATSATVVPASIRSLSVISEPRLDVASGAIPWYLFANPAGFDTVEYAYLEGAEGVAIETRNGFDVDGVEVKARLDFGAKAIDWRGMYKNPGVSP